MRNYIFLLCMLLMPGISHADTNWYRVAANTALIADMMQTVEIAKNDDYYETNGLLGEQPSVDEVYKYFLTSIALTNIVGELLPREYGDYLYISVAVIETRVVTANYTLGIRVGF